MRSEIIVDGLVFSSLLGGLNDGVCV